MLLLKAFWGSTRFQRHRWLRGVYAKQIKDFRVSRSGLGFMVMGLGFMGYGLWV